LIIINFAAFTFSANVTNVNTKFTSVDINALMRETLRSTVVKN